MKPLLIGMEPDGGDDDLELRDVDGNYLPFVDSAAGRRLAEMCRLDSGRDLPRLFDVVNLFPEARPDGAGWSRPQARASARAVVAGAIRDRRQTLVCLGHQVFDAVVRTDSTAVGAEVGWFDAVMIPDPAPPVGDDLAPPSAFGGDVPGLEQVDAIPDLFVILVPHPSSRNSWWHDRTNQDTAERFFLDLAYPKTQSCWRHKRNTAGCPTCAHRAREYTRERRLKAKGPDAPPPRRPRLEVVDGACPYSADPTNLQAPCPGDRTMYSKGCRSGPCMAANREYQRDYMRYRDRADDDRRRNANNVVVQIRLPKAAAEQLRSRADGENVSLSKLARGALLEFLDDKTPPL